MKIYFSQFNIQTLKTNILLSKIEHKGEIRIKVLMEKRSDFIAKIKNIKGRKWSKTKNCWHLPYSKNSYSKLKLVFGEKNITLPHLNNFLIKLLKLSTVNILLEMKKERKSLEIKSLFKRKIMIG